MSNDRIDFSAEAAERLEVVNAVLAFFGADKVHWLTSQDASLVSTVVVFGLLRVMMPTCVCKWRSVKETLSPA